MDPKELSLKLALTDIALDDAPKDHGSGLLNGFHKLAKVRCVLFVSFAVRRGSISPTFSTSLKPSMRVF
jgi:hypothetical protein